MPFSSHAKRDVALHSCSQALLYTDTQMSRGSRAHHFAEDAAVGRADAQVARQLVRKLLALGGQPRGVPLYDQHPLWGVLQRNVFAMCEDFQRSLSRCNGLDDVRLFCVM